MKQQRRTHCRQVHYFPHESGIGAETLLQIVPPQDIQSMMQPCCIAARSTQLADMIYGILPAAKRDHSSADAHPSSRYSMTGPARRTALTCPSATAPSAAASSTPSTPRLARPSSVTSPPWRSRRLRAKTNYKKCHSIIVEKLHTAIPPVAQVAAEPVRSEECNFNFRWVQITSL